MVYTKSFQTTMRLRNSLTKNIICCRFVVAGYWTLVSSQVFITFANTISSRMKTKLTITMMIARRILFYYLLIFSSLCIKTINTCQVCLYNSYIYNNIGMSSLLPSLDTIETLRQQNPQQVRQEQSIFWDNNNIRKSSSISLNKEYPLNIVVPYPTIVISLFVSNQYLQKKLTQPFIPTRYQTKSNLAWMIDNDHNHEFIMKSIEDEVIFSNNMTDSISNTTTVSLTVATANTTTELLSSTSSMMMIITIGFYKDWISPLLPPACRFVPTCSQYGVQSIQTYGPLKGVILIIWRLLRCSPIGGKGYDPPKWPPVSYTYSSY